MSQRVGLLYCSERESAAIRGQLSATHDVVPMDLGETPSEPVSFVVIGGSVTQRRALLTAVRQRLGETPAVLLAAPESAQQPLEEIDTITLGELHRLPHIIRRETRLRETEMLLRKSERRYWELTENAPEGLWIVDAAGVTTFANRKMAALLGCRVADVIGKPMMELVDDEWQAVAASSLERKRHGIAETYDLRFRRPNGSTFFATVSSRPIHDEHAAFIGASSLVIDITARRELEEALLRRETELSIAHELAQLGSWEWDFETNRIFGSSELFRLLGLGNDAGALDFEEWLMIVDRDDVAALRESLKRAVSEGTEFEHEYRLRGDARRIVHSRGRVIRGAAGLPRRMIGMVQDVTQLMKGAEELRRSEQRFRALVEQATDVIFSLDSDGRFTSVNPAFEAITGWSAEEWIGKPFLHCIAPRSHDAAREQLAGAMRGESSIAEYELCTRGGGPVTVETTVQAITGDGPDAGMVGIARDVTRRNETERALEEAKRLSSLGHLAAAVAHEFNNVLMSILPFAELLKRRAPDDERTALAAHHIFKAIRRGRQISQEILRFAKPMAIEMANVDLREWLRDFTREAAALLGPKYRILSGASLAGALYARADRAALDRVTTNLLLNARDAMPDGGVITINARPSETDPGFVAVRVKDEGSGIAPDVIGHVFEPLFTTKHGGTGLGLSISYTAMQQMRGMLRVESKQGEGSEFTILLRIGEKPAGEPAPQPRLETKRRRVLLVEDDDAVGEGIRSLLGDEGFAVHLVRRGAEAPRSVAEFNPDVVILDVNLPDINGLEVLQTIRSSWPALPVVLSTGQADAGAIDSIRRLSVPALIKPYEFGDLLAVLERVW